MSPRHPRHITVSRQRWPERYFSGLSRALQVVRARELLARRRTAHPKLSRSDRGVSRPKSRWTQQFHKVFPGLKFDKGAIAQRTGISRRALNTVYDRGLKAWKTGGSRPGATAQQWAIARLYKFVLISKKRAPRVWYATRFDPDANLKH
jgi:hypothetical protein